VPNGAAVEAVARRADRVIADARAAEGDVALFGHDISYASSQPTGSVQLLEEGAGFSLAPATLSVLDREREAPVIARWNDAGHLVEGWCAVS
jgi:hypothetical protein